MFLTLGVKAKGTISHGQMWAILPQTARQLVGSVFVAPALQLGRRQFVAPVDTSITFTQSRAGENHRARHGTVLQRRAV